jgi:ppGpp synthetase/RelA/SpoT-type nucleotidyltranferase
MWRSPKGDGYRALHLINRNRGRLIEIQLRTPRQDLWANFVERLSRTVIPGLKFGEGPQVLHDYLLDTAEIMADGDQGLVTDAVTLDRMKNRAIELVNLLFGEADEP